MNNMNAKNILRKTKPVILLAWFGFWVLGVRPPVMMQNIDSTEIRTCSNMEGGVRYGNREI
jgi:hypothetical protein